MFGDNFPQEHVIGFFNLGHALLIIVYLFGIIALAIHNRKHTRQYIEGVIKACAIYLIVTELIKIIVAFFETRSFSAMFPMPYCSLFIPAIILAMFKNKTVKHIGYTFMVVGGLVGGILYIFFPNGSIDAYPLYHVKAIHGISYHFIMAFLGLTLLTTGMFKLKKQDWIYYCSFFAFFTMIAIFNNTFLGTESLFLNTGAGIKILNEICDRVPLIYGLGVFSAECFLAFFGIFYIYRFIKRHFHFKTQSVVILQENGVEPENA